MRKKLIILLFSLVVFITSVVSAQPPDYHIQLFNERDGLHSYLMLSVLKDQNGFIWVLSQYKIQRFDGKLVEEYIFDERLYSFVCDDQNNIWTASRSNFFRYNDKRKGFEKIAHDTTNQPIIGKLLKIAGYPVVAPTTNGFYFFDSNNNLFKKITSGPLSFTKRFELLNADVYGTSVFVQAKDTLYSIDARSGGIRKLGGAKDVFSFYAMNEDMALLSLYNNYCYWYDFKKSSIIKIDIGKGLGQSSSYFLRTFDVQRLNDSEYFISTILGLLLYNSESGRFRKQQLFLDGKPLQGEDLIEDLIIDKERNVWAAYGYGLIYFKAVEGQFGLIRNAETDKKLSWDNDVRGFAEDEQGNLWMVTKNGFAYYDMKKGKIAPYHPNINDTNTYSFPSVRGIAYDGDNVILGPTNRGMWLYHIKSKTYNRPVFQPNETGKKLKEKLQNDFIGHICRLRTGDYIVSARDGFYFMEDKKFLITAIHFPGETERGNFAYQDKSGYIWLGTRNGLYCFDSNMKYRFRAIHDFNPHTMVELHTGEFLVGGMGTYLVKKRADNTMEMDTLDPYFKNLIVSFLFQDKQKKIWLATSEGLIRYDIKSRKIELFNFFDNIQGNMFNSRAGYFTKAGVLFLGGVNGINYLEPEKVQSRNDSLKIVITRLAVNDIEEDPQTINKLRLKHFQNSIEVRFSAPYFSNTNRVQYRYWLKGLDKQWISNGNSNTMRFSSLAPGNYEFKVAASIDEEHWFESGKNFSFMIRPPFWKTWWFISMFAVVIALSVYGVYKYQLYKRLEVERFRSRVSRDLHDDIGSTLSSINILSKSSLTQHKENDDKTLILQKIQNRSQKMLDAMDDLIWSTKPENDSLESLIIRMREYAAEVFEAAGIQYTLDCPVAIHSLKLDIQQKKNLYLIFKEAINNLSKYSNSSKALIRFEYQKKFLQMLIIDEGSGFTLTSIKKGNGLDNMQSRASEMNAQFEIQSGVGRGTTIRVHLPV